MKDLSQLIRKVKCCDHPSMIAQLEEDFNDIGMSIQNQNGQLFLCKLEDGKPVSGKIFESFVPVGGLHDTIDDKSLERIFHFIIEHCACPQRIKSKNTGNFALYGDSFHADAQLINAISEWLDA